MADPDPPRVEVVEDLEPVPVPLHVEHRLTFLARHLGMDRAEVAGKLLGMIFREGLEWDDLEYLRDLAGRAPDPDPPGQAEVPP